MNVFNTQIGGSHYKKLPVQPVEYIYRNKIGFIEGSVIKYVTRWKNKNGIEDLKKALHMLELLIEMETKYGKDFGKEISLHGKVSKTTRKRREKGR